MEEEEGALVLEADMVAVAEIFLLAFLFVTFVVIAGQKILEGHSGSLVPLKIFTCLRTITLGSHVALVLSSMWILLMHLKLNIIWMVKFSMVEN